MGRLLSEKTLLAALLVIALVVGLYARFHGFGERILATDEYFLSTSISSVSEHGVPALAGGGYYTQSLLYQYIAAAFAPFIDNPIIAHKWPALFFGLLAVLLSYFYSRQFLSRPLAIAISVTLLLSSWHIEFSRFLRMYTLFQCVTLLFLIAVHQAYYLNKWHLRYLPHAVLVVAAFTHLLGLVLAPLLFIPLTSAGRKDRFPTFGAYLRFGLVSLMTLLAYLAFMKFGFRLHGVVDPLPVDFVFPDGGSRYNLPIFPFWGQGVSPFAILMLFVVAGGIVMGGLWFAGRKGKDVRTSDYFLVALLVSALAHVLIVFAMVLFVLVFRYDILRFSQHHKRTYLVLGLSMAIVAAWVGFALLTRDWINFFSDFAYQGKYLYMKLLQLTFLSWPNPRPTLRPLFVELPVIGSLLVVSVLYLSAIKLKDSLDSLIANPGFIIFYVFVCFGILNTDYITTRYAFFVYPAALCTIALAISCFLERLQRKGIGLGRLGSGSAAVIVYFLIFAVSNEFNPSHIAQVGSDQVAFRTGPFERYSRTWYPRIDIRSPASFVNANAQTNQNDAVVVDDFSALSHYLDLPHGLYIDWSDGRFAGLSRSGGTRNTWTDGPLLGRVEDLRAYGEGHQRLWVIRPTDERRQRLPLEAAFGARIGEVERVFLSKDGRVEVLRMDLAQDGSQ